MCKHCIYWIATNPEMFGKCHNPQSLLMNYPTFANSFCDYFSRKRKDETGEPDLEFLKNFLGFK